MYINSQCVEQGFKTRTEPYGPTRKTLNCSLLRFFQPQKPFYGKKQGPVQTMVGPHDSENRDQTTSHDSLLPIESKQTNKQTKKKGKRKKTRTKQGWHHEATASSSSSFFFFFVFSICLPLSFNGSCRFNSELFFLLFGVLIGLAIVESSFCNLRPLDHTTISFYSSSHSHQLDLSVMVFADCCFSFFLSALFPTALSAFFSLSLCILLLPLHS